MAGHCCADMAGHLEHRCETHADPFDCPNAVVVYVAESRSYVLPVHDGGSSFIAIRYCPWCGVRLPSPSGGE
ncbi:hypothetical protein FXF51_05200 [Nonomuraea sp. PA05]|nr:hypothetical protein FXF51_05200 [Nonomuraea sp. PA05]